MKTHLRWRAHAASVVIPLFAIVLGSGCSGPQEDVRVTTCKRLAQQLLVDPDEISWQQVDKEFHQPEYAVARLSFETRYAGSDSLSPMTAACYYAYDTVEQDARTHADPFSAYETQPYKMELNGEPVAKRLLTGAMNQVLKDQGRKIVETVDRTAREIKEGIERELNR